MNQKGGWVLKWMHAEGEEQGNLENNVISISSVWLPSKLKREKSDSGQVKNELLQLTADTYCYYKKITQSNNTVVVYVIFLYPEQNTTKYFIMSSVSPSVMLIMGLWSPYLTRVINCNFDERSVEKPNIPWIDGMNKKKWISYNWIFSTRKWWIQYQAVHKGLGFWNYNRKEWRNCGTWWYDHSGEKFYNGRTWQMPLPAFGWPTNRLDVQLYFPNGYSLLFPEGCVMLSFPH